MKISFKKFIKSLRGFSVPIFGVSWEPPSSDREAARKLILYLEDRRVLFYPYDMEDVRFAIDSVLEVRKKLTNEIQTLDEKSDLINHLNAMRAACRKFLDAMDKFRTNRSYYHFSMLMIPLGELRGVFGIHVAQISVKYGINISSELATILPIEDKED